MAFLISNEGLTEATLTPPPPEETGVLVVPFRVKTAVLVPFRVFNLIRRTAEVSVCALI